jgi:hypothetical protein
MLDSAFIVEVFFQIMVKKKVHMHDYSKLIHFFYCLQGVDMGNESEESVGN